ncbi:hypothetical protein ACNPNP_10105 [Microbacterium sp. AGC85]
MEEIKSSLSRRTLVKGAAWSIPVIAAAVATPLAAASNIPGGGALSVGSLVESSDNIRDTIASASSARVESCFPSNMFTKPFVLTATLTYDGSDSAFNLAGSTHVSAGSVWSVVSVTANVVTLTAVQTVSCYAGITGFEIQYNAGVVPPLNSLVINISGVSTDGEMKIDGLVSAVNALGPVQGPKVHDTDPA